MIGCHFSFLVVPVFSLCFFVGTTAPQLRLQHYYVFLCILVVAVICEIVFVSVRVGNF